MRSIGFINTIILARLLKPEDFGLIALSMLIVGLVTIFANTGMSQAILRRKEISSSLLNTAWTMKVIIGCMLSISIILIAPIAAKYFHDPRIESLIRVMALLPLLDSLSNIGMVFYARELEFRKLFYRTFFSKILAVSVGISVAYWMQNYWALAVGMLLKSIINLLTTYILHPYRPRTSLSNLKELMPDSINSVSRNIATFLSLKADEYFIGYLAGANNLGGYYIAKSVTNMLAVELVQPIGHALLPGYTKMIGDDKRQKQAVLKVLQTITIISFATATGLVCIADNFILVVFGNQWVHITPLFIIFSLLGGINSLQSVPGPILLAKGRLRTISYYAWFNLILLILILWHLSETKNILLIAEYILYLNIFTLIINYSFLVKYVKINIIEIIESIYKPIVASLAMLYAISQIKSFWLTDLSIINLILTVIIGATIYLTTLLFLWLIKRDKNSIEYLLLAKLLKL